MQVAWLGQECWVPTISDELAAPQSVWFDTKDARKVLGATGARALVKVPPGRGDAKIGEDAIRAALAALGVPAVLTPAHVLPLLAAWRADATFTTSTAHTQEIYRFLSASIKTHAGVDDRRTLDEVRAVFRSSPY